MKSFIQSFGLLWCLGLICLSLDGWASSHREAPLISNDPLADNTDVYAFRSPDDQQTVTLIANYVPFQLPQGGPNYYQFGENIRYEIHIDNDVTTTGDDIIYRFTFHLQNEDPTTFFNIRLGQENLKTTYTMERSMDGGHSFQTVITSGMVPPPNIGARSINSPIGVGSTYEDLVQQAIQTTSVGEKVFCGTADDPFFVDLGGIFDLGDSPRQSDTPKDGVSCLNVSTIAIQVPIHLLQKDGKDVSQATNILDGDFVIGVWASASRPSMRTLNVDGTRSYTGNWVQVSRLGMPLTNEAVIPIGEKDEWNARTPYNENPDHFEYFYNPELGLYMDDSLFGGAVPAFVPLRIQRNSLGAFDFGNGQDGLFGLKGSPAVAGTALDDAIFGSLLLPAAGKPRSVDLWPAFHTGVPNVPPYQLATGKGGNPLAVGKPFVNNFLPNGGDMLRLNMATPVTDRNDPAFSSSGLIQAAVLGLTDPTFAGNTYLEFIPNMDGFPNGRRLEDDVTRIELQAVGGVVLAAIGLWYDDFDPNDPYASPVTQDLLNVLTYTTGIETNDTTFRSSFPYVQTPWPGDGKCGGLPVIYDQPTVLDPTGDLAAPSNLVADNGTFFIVPLTWEDNATNEEGFVIRRTSSQGTEMVASVGANVTSFTDTVLIFGEPITYSVTAFAGQQESAPSNDAVYEIPAHVGRLDITFVCYNANTDSITWNVFNPNIQQLPYIYAQWWTPQRDTLLALPGNSTFKTKNNPQNGSTFGDDNITGVWWIDETLRPGQPNDIEFSIPLNVSCSSARIASQPAAPKAGGIYKGRLARTIRSTDIEREFLRASLSVYPNPFTDVLTLDLPEGLAQVEVNILTLDGKIVASKRIEDEGALKLDLSKLSTGVYFVQVVTANVSITQEILKE
ncbi:MAG: DUF4331 family protein [Bacteroidota bacterium]